MRHRVAGKKLNRNAAQRSYLRTNLLRSFVLYGKVETTKAKAKFIVPHIEKLVTSARAGDLVARRKLYQVLDNKNLVDHFLTKIVPAFKDRPGGYTRTIRLGIRAGDAAEMARVEWVEKIVFEEEAGKEKKKKTLKQKVVKEDKEISKDGEKVEKKAKETKEKKVEEVKKPVEGK